MQSPLEQFLIFPIIEINLFSIDLSITNFFLTGIFSLIVLISLDNIIKEYKNNEFSYLSTPTGWQYIVEILYSLSIAIASDVIGRRKGEIYAPMVTVVFVFILINNVIGLIPYSFTITSHIILTFFLSFSIFVAMNIIGIKKYGIEFFSFFLPPNTSFFLALLLVPIEIISHIAKPISLGVRLFINLMAGHSLLKVIVGFSYNILQVESYESLFFIFPIGILVLLFGLELGVAVIQAYVFITLTTIYLNESECLH